MPAGVEVNMTFLDFLEHCLRELGSLEVEIVLTVAWMLWVARNELMWDGIHSNVDDVCNRAFVVALEFLEFGGGENVAVELAEIREVWRPPQYGSYKVSIACHFRLASAHMWVGILIRDHEGAVVVASGFVLQKYEDHLINFSFAVFYALQLAYETGFRNFIVIEVPSRELTGLLNLDTPCLEPSGVVIEDVHTWCGFFFQYSVCFYF
jgi:hypothetical protein